MMQDRINDLQNKIQKIVLSINQLEEKLRYVTAEEWGADKSTTREDIISRLEYLRTKKDILDQQLSLVLESDSFLSLSLGDRKLSIRIVPAELADSQFGLVSEDSPIAKAISASRKTGGEVMFNGSMRLKVA